MQLEKHFVGSPIRLLIFAESFHPYTSGVARRFKKIIEHLAHTNDYLIHVVTGCKGCETAWPNDPFMQSKVTYSTSLFTIDFKDTIECALPFLIPQPGLIREIFNFKPDIVHCVEHTPAATFFGAIAKSFNIPIVWSSHTNLDFYLPLYIRPLTATASVRVNQLIRRTYFNLADVTLTVSQEFGNLLVGQGIKRPVHIWKTGVDEKAFSPEFRCNDMRVRMFNGNYASDKILLVSVGRLSPEKNFEFLIGILAEYPQAFLCLVGDGPYKESLKPLFPENQTYFMGFLQGSELAQAYASADYFVYASVSETFGQVYLEAMSSGVPIVAAEGKQMKEFFTSGIHGHTWEPDNLTHAIYALDLTMKSREEFSENCRRNALSHSWSCPGKQIEKIYSQIARQSNRNSVGKLKIIGRLVFYLVQWSLLMLLVVVFMLPFLKVQKPRAARAGREAFEGVERRKRRNQVSCNGDGRGAFVLMFLDNQGQLFRSSMNLILLVCTCSVISFVLFYNYKAGGRAQWPMDFIF